MTKKEIRIETSIYSLCILVGTLSPLLISLLFYFSRWQHLCFLSLIIDGQFYLYSASLLTSACYLYYTHKARNYDSNSILFLISAGINVISAILYAMLIVDPEKSDTTVLLYTSLIIFTVSALLFINSNYRNFQQIDLTTNYNDEINSIIDQLNN